MSFGKLSWKIVTVDQWADYLNEHKASAQEYREEELDCMVHTAAGVPIGIVMYFPPVFEHRTERVYGIRAGTNDLPMEESEVPNIPYMSALQARAIYRKWQQPSFSMGTLYEYLATAQPTIGCDGAVVLQWAGMWLAIERDGYTHS